MKKHVRNYFRALGLDPGDWIVCEVCQEKEAVDIHHIVPRGLRGSDEADNLIALCRECHIKAHNEDMKDKLFEIVTNRK